MKAKRIFAAVIAAGVAMLTGDALPELMPGVRNPVMWADVPDPSLCSDGEKFYLVSTTMHLVPGVPIMESSDMVDWKTVSYVLPRFEPGDYPNADSDWGRYNLDSNRTAYGQGQWATTIRYHRGKFYVWFVCNGARGYLYVADSARGPWKLHSRPSYMHDGGLMFDDDGKAYVFWGSGGVSQLKDDLSDVDPDGVNLDLAKWTRTPEETGLLEGSHAIRRGDYYYLLMISMEWGVEGRIRREVCYRAKDIRGPYERKVVLEVPFESWGGLGQGDIVERGGKWYAMIFQDRGGVGRVPCLMPVRWVDDWPMLGEKNPDEGVKPNCVGLIPNDASKPYPSVKGYIGSDDFSGGELSLYWQWNHNPVDWMWSLSERPGWLRLKAATVTDSLFLARNTLTQRMCGPRCSGAVKMDLSNMRDGDVAGLAAFQGDSGVLAVRCRGGKKTLEMHEARSVFGPHRSIDKTVRLVRASVPLRSDAVWLRVRADFTAGADFAEFDWSEDGVEWREIGVRTPVRFDHTRMFMGTKFAIFCHATKELGGWVDVDRFDFAAEEHED